MLRDGVAALDKAAGGSFATASEAKQLEIVKAMQGQPFFNAVRGKCITSLYNNDMAFATFGYPGPRWEKGGYITRGFQDLKWLPDPPAAASRSQRALSLHVLAASRPKGDIHGEVRLQSDDSVVVIIGSGAGGGTLANELCQKGIKVVVLEAGARQSQRDLHQRRMEVFRPAGVARSAHDLGHLARREGLPGPAGLDLQDGGWHHRALGRRLAALPASTSSRRAPPTATSRARRLLDWPLTLKELEPYYARAEDKMGVTRTNDIPGLPGNNNFKVMYAGATQARLQGVHTGHMAINSQPRDGRGAVMQIGFCFQGCKAAPSGRRSTPRFPRPRATGNLDLRPESHVVRIEHNDAGKVTSVVYIDKDGKQQRQKARAVCVAGNSIETPRLLLLSASSKYSGRAGQLLGPGRQATTCVT